MSIESIEVSDLPDSICHAIVTAINALTYISSSPAIWNLFVEETNRLAGRDIFPSNREEMRLHVQSEHVTHLLMDHLNFHR